MGSIRLGKYAKESAEAMADWCLANGLDFCFEGFTGKGHPQYVIGWQDQTRKITTASSTSDHRRALKNCVSQCRRLALEMGWTEADGAAAFRKQEAIKKALNGSTKIANQAIKKTETEQTMDKPETDTETGNPCPRPLPDQIMASNRPRYTGAFGERINERNAWIEEQLETRVAAAVYQDVTDAGWKFDTPIAMRQALNWAKRKQRQEAEARAEMPLAEALVKAIEPVIEAIIEREVEKRTGEIQAKLDLVKEVMGQ